MTERNAVAVAFKRIAAVLEPLTPNERERVLRAASILFDQTPGIPAPNECRERADLG